VILGLSRDFPTMLLARMLDGASGGNILVAQAYVADVTRPEHRARGMGLIGMAFGVGFVFGPLLGGVILHLPVSPEWRLRLPFLVAAGFSTLAFGMVLLWLPESLPADASARQAARVVSWHGLIETVRRPSVAMLVGVGALSIVAFGALESTYGLFLQKRRGWNEASAAFGFAFLGLVSAVVQGGLIRRLVPKFGEPRLIVAGVATMGLGMALLAPASGLAWMLIATLVVAVGQGLLSPSVSGLLSRVTPAGEQGAVFGTLSASQTMARLLVYVPANMAFARISPAAPFVGAAVVSALTLGLALVAAQRVSQVVPEPIAAK
jgi:MFS transporter, DHA1 family, tetracycline resistance protein